MVAEVEIMVPAGDEHTLWSQEGVDNLVGKRVSVHGEDWWTTRARMSEDRKWAFVTIRPPEGA